MVLIKYFLSRPRTENVRSEVAVDTGNPGGGGGVLPYKGLMGACGQPGYVFRDFCLKQGTGYCSLCSVAYVHSYCFIYCFVPELVKVLKNRIKVRIKGKKV